MFTLDKPSSIRHGHVTRVHVALDEHYTACLVLRDRIPVGDPIVTPAEYATASVWDGTVVACGSCDEHVADAVLDGEWITDAEGPRTADGVWPVATR